MAKKAEKNKSPKATAPQDTPLKLGSNLSFASSEAYNLLRTNLSFLFTEETGRGKIIGVTSACPQEGKSFTSTNIAYTFAADGKKVLLIDGDMRCPTLYIKLNIPSTPGLSNLLVGSDVKPIVKGVLHENLDVLSSGDIPPNPADLIGSARMQELLNQLASVYDYVFLDLPPVNEVSDPISVSKYLDGMIMVIRHGGSRQSEVMEMVRRLNFVNARLLGFVYNSYSIVRGRHSGGGYNYGYGKRYGYGYGEQYGYGKHYRYGYRNKKKAPDEKKADDSAPEQKSNGNQ